jgi:hypothetical protein
MQFNAAILMSTEDINYTKEAFLNNWNLAFLAVAAVTSVVLAGVANIPIWLPLLFVTAGELLYLGTVPRNQRFRRLVRSQKIAERRKPPSQKEIFQLLTRRSQRRYARLRKLKDEIRENYQSLSYASQGLLDSHVRKIDDLLESYLNLLHQRERYRSYIDNATEEDIEQSIAALKEDMADDSDRVRAVKQRRLHVLEQRKARFQKGHEKLEIIGAQLGTIEDVVKYIHEQSWTLQNPEEISFQLDTLLEEVEETQASVQEIEEVFAGPGELLGDMDTLDEGDEDVSTSSDTVSSSRERMRN